MFERLIKKIAQKFKEEKIDYMITGGQAVLLYGEPRLTRDIDITLGFGIENLKKIKRIVKDLNLKILVEEVEEFVTRTYVLPTLDVNTQIRVDFTFSSSVYEKEALKRVKVIKIGRTEVKFISVEDLIIHKIIAHRPQDLQDIKSIICKHPNLDEDYIKNWLSKFEKALDKKFIRIFEKIKKS